MNRAVKNFNNLLNLSFLMIALDIIVGGLFIFYTEMASTVAVVITGCLILVHGIFALIDYFYVGMLFKFLKYKYIPGIVLVLLGIVVIINPIATINLLGIGVGLWLLAIGIENLAFAIRLFNYQEDISSLILFIAICALLMGVLVIINPFEKFMLITKLAGIFIVANGFLDIVRILLFKKRARNIIEVFK